MIPTRLDDPAPEIERLQQRLRRLAEEKSNLQLVLSLIQRLNPLPGIDDMVRSMLHGIVDTIGGTNIKAYYWIEEELHYIDFLGDNRVLPKIDDALALEVTERKEFVELSGDPSAALLQGSYIPGSWTWAFPLLVGEQLVGVVKLENVHIIGTSLRDYLPAFFSHVALILSNEIRNNLRLKAQAALREKADELEKKTLAITRTNDDLKRFAEVTAHHLREPARCIAIYADRLDQQLGERLEDPESRLSLEFIRQHARRQQALLHDVERYLASDQPRGKLSSIDPRLTLNKILTLLRDRIDQAGGEITVGDLPPVCIDLPRLTDLFTIALDNALCYGRSSRALRIKIDGERREGKVCFSVSDNGTGEEAQNRDRVFRIFERLSVNAEVAGTGIGLAVLRRIAESCDGRAWIEEAPGGGCRILFELPYGGQS